MSQENFRRHKISIQPECCQPDVEAKSSNWITTCPSFMPNLKLTGRTVEFFWSGCQEVSRLLTTCNLLQHHPARGERSKFVRWNVSSFPFFFSTPPFTQFYSFHSVLSLHLFKTLTSFMTFVKLQLSVSGYCCFRRGAAGWANKGCMWSWGLLDLFLSPRTHFS